MVFGRCFETALGAYFRAEDSEAALFQELQGFRDTPLDYRKGETWDRLLHQGIHLLQRFAQDRRVHICDASKNLQIKKVKALAGGGEFVAYVDAIGKVDGVRCLIDSAATR